MAENSSKKSIGASILQQLANNGYSMLLETIIMFLIAAYAIAEVRDVKRDVADRIATSHEAFVEYSKQQGERLDAVTTELTKTTELLAAAMGVTLEDYQQNREQVYAQLKEGGSQAFKEYLKAKFGSDETSEESENQSLTSD